MTIRAFALIALALCGSAAVGDEMGKQKKLAMLWYDAFNNTDPALIEKVLAPTWVDIPAANGQPSGPQGAKQAVIFLTTTFKDFHVEVEDIVEDGDKVVVRSTITGTQVKTFMGIPPNNARIRIQAVDIHQFHNGKIVKTWHTEDWMSGLRQLGAFENK
jgi:steroid delta-isomerase-like uncharacterized protein